MLTCRGNLILSLGLRQRQRFARSSLLAIVAALSLPAGASAADTYVDRAIGDDSNPCTSPAAPCQNIGGATGGIAKAGAGDTVHVADPAGPQTYAETLTLDNGKSLVAESPDPTETIIDNGATASPAVTVTGTTGLLRGFTIRSQHQAVSLQSGATITGNVFDSSTLPGGPDNADVNVTSGAGSPTITGNAFSDSSSDDQTALSSVATGSLVVTQNSFSGFLRAVSVASSSPTTATISQNVITGTHGTAFAGVGIRVGQGITATVTGNSLFAAGTGSTTGIGVFQGSLSPNAGASLRRNVIIGHTFGVNIGSTLGAVTLQGDLVAKATDSGITAFDVLWAGGGDFTAINVTSIDSAVYDINLGNGADATLDSIIVGAGGLNPAINDPATGTCSISFSRGDGNGDCATGFVTTANPMFVDPAANDYHLQAASPMIDAGDPADPGGALDLDGGARALDGDCDGTARRDIGADEFVPNCPEPPSNGGSGDIDPPETTITKRPKDKTKKKSATFEFSSDEPGSSFQCSLDDGPFQPCSSPDTLKVKKGKHSFEVRATDAAGNADPTPAADAWKVKKKKNK